MVGRALNNPVAYYRSGVACIVIVRVGEIDPVAPQDVGISRLNPGLAKVPDAYQVAYWTYFPFT